MKKYIPALFFSFVVGIFLTIYFGLLYPGVYLLVIVPMIFGVYLVGFIGIFKFVTKQSTVKELAIIGIAPYIIINSFLGISVSISRAQDKLMMVKSEKQDQLVRNNIPSGIEFKRPSYLFATRFTNQHSVLVANIPIEVRTNFDYERLVNNLSFQVDNQPGIFFVLPDCQIGNVFYQINGFHKSKGVTVRPGNYEFTVKFLFYGQGCNNGLLDYLKRRGIVISRNKDNRTRVSYINYPIREVSIVNNPSEEFMY